MKIKVKRVYDPPATTDGRRILVDRLWPRGLSKEKAGIDFWAREISPSTELRRWYGHDPEKWPEFKAKYSEELKAKPEDVEEFLQHVGRGTATFLYGSKEEHLNNAVALKEYVESRE